MGVTRQGGGLGKTITAFTLGATAGSAIALLFAPASGQVTRRRINMKLREVQRSTVRQVELAKRQLAKKAGYLREAAQDQINQAREWVVARTTNGNGKHAARRRAVHQA